MIPSRKHSIIAVISAVMLLLIGAFGVVIAVLQGIGAC